MDAAHATLTMDPNDSAGGAPTPLPSAQAAKNGLFASAARTGPSPPPPGLGGLAAASRGAGRATSVAKGCSCCGAPQKRVPTCGALSHPCLVGNPRCMERTAQEREALQLRGTGARRDRGSRGGHGAGRGRVPGKRRRLAYPLHADANAGGAQRDAGDRVAGAGADASADAGAGVGGGGHAAVVALPSHLGESPVAQARAVAGRRGAASDTEDGALVDDGGFGHQLRRHQADGVAFLWQQCVQNPTAFAAGPGSGAILAHKDGEGKKLQIIAFLHTVMHAAPLGHRPKNAVIAVPGVKVAAWGAEFEKWSAGGVAVFVARPDDATDQEKEQQVRPPLRSAGRRAVVHSTPHQRSSPALVRARAACTLHGRGRDRWLLLPVVGWPVGRLPVANRAAHDAWRRRQPTCPRHAWNSAAPLSCVCVCVSFGS